jgi:hypothetical protein
LVLAPEPKDLARSAVAARETGNGLGRTRPNEHAQKPSQKSNLAVRAGSGKKIVSGLADRKTRTYATLCAVGVLPPLARNQVTVKTSLEIKMENTGPQQIQARVGLWSGAQPL